MRGDHAPLRHDAQIFARLEHHGAGSIPKEDAGASIRPIENAREGLRSDHEGAFVRAGGEKFIGRRERKDEAGAHRLKIESDTMGDAECRLDLRRGRWKVWSGVEVARMMRSISCASILASASAAFAAARPSVAVVSPSPATWRSLMPVRCTIHSSEVSTIFDSSSLVTTRRGSERAGAQDHRSRCLHAVRSSACAFRGARRSGVVSRARGGELGRAQARLNDSTRL